MGDIPENPWAGRIGWCHACETVQTGDEARYIPMWWDDANEPDWSCVNCDGEPWGLGVWPDQVGYPHAEWTESAKKFDLVTCVDPECDMDCGRVHLWRQPRIASLPSSNVVSFLRPPIIRRFFSSTESLNRLDGIGSTTPAVSPLRL